MALAGNEEATVRLAGSPAPKNAVVSPMQARLLRLAFHVSATQRAEFEVQAGQKL
ncbi:MAG: hypothetical protein JOY56_13940 [Solirubrobacterales bacterium]|nr:hypothetical protein [Solirubrobacterales bacterium]